MKKKVLYLIGTLALLCVLFALPAHAARYTNTPASMAFAGENGDVVFTIEEVDTYAYLTYDDYGVMTKELSVWVTGTPNFGDPSFLVYCYDQYGNHIQTVYLDSYQDSEYNLYHGYVMTDRNTASIEILPAEAGSWYNSYYYCRYANVSSIDGRKLGIHDLLVPNYVEVGWYEDVTLYSLDGRAINVAYCDMNAYKAVGWYDWEDMYMMEFRNSYRDNLAAKDYEAIMSDAGYIKEFFYNPAYREEGAAAFIYAMDMWRKEINAPMALVDSYIYYDDEYDEQTLALTFRNVSYKTIVAYKTLLTCCDIFGDITEREREYYATEVYIEPGEKETLYYTLYDYDSDHIKGFKLTQVVFEDRTSWKK